MNDQCALLLSLNCKDVPRRLKVSSSDPVSRSVYRFAHLRSSFTEFSLRLKVFPTRQERIISERPLSSSVIHIIITRTSIDAVEVAPQTDIARHRSECKRIDHYDAETVDGITVSSRPRRCGRSWLTERECLHSTFSKNEINKTNDSFSIGCGYYI